MSLEIPEISKVPGEVRHDSWDTGYLIFVIAFAIPFIVLALVGNSLIVVAWAIHRPIRTPSNLYLVSLAFGDLLTAVFVIPEVFSQDIPASWCKFWLTLTFTFNVVTPFHLIAISIDRYRTVAEGVPYLQRRSIKNVGEKLAIIWILSVWVMGPLLFDWEHSTVDSSGETYCLSKKTRHWVFHYGLISYWLPAAFLIINYRKVYVELHRRMSHLRNTGMNLLEVSSEAIKPSEQSKSDVTAAVPAVRLSPSSSCHTDWHSSESGVSTTPACLSVAHSEEQMLTLGKKRSGACGTNDLKLKARERKSIITVIIISGTFILFGLPWNLASFYDAFIDPENPTSVSGLVYSATYTFSQTNCFVNPILYTARIPEFRAALSILRNKLCCSNPT